MGTDLFWRVTRALGIAVAAALLGSAALPVSAQSGKTDPDSVCSIETSERVVAVGDVHGAFDNFVAILRTAGIIDTRNRWAGGRAVFVQTGDILDRGADSRKAVDLIRRLERDAPRAGGRVVSLLGNHELSRVIDDWRYVSAGELDAFKTRDSEQLRDNVLMLSSQRAEERAKGEGRPFDAAAFKAQFLKEVPLGMIEMRQAFGPDGEYGRWVRERAAVARINGVLFLHGGISPGVATLGCEGINAAVGKELASLPLPPEKLNALMSVGETGPLWYRGLASDPTESVTMTLPGILQQMQARAIVMGHTTVLPGRIATRLGGRIILIDSGMLDGAFYPGGVPSALEMRGNIFIAIYLDHRDPVMTPEVASVEQKDGA